MIDGQGLPGGIVRAEQVSYRYPQNGFGLAETSLRLERGERVLIAGPSGSGKSTLARCLTGLIPHLFRGTMQGAVWLDGLRTNDAPLWRLTEVAGLVFQNPATQMLAPTVEDEIVFGLENLGLPRATIGKRLDESLARFGLELLRSRAPQELSGGEQQKLALAAMCARQTPLLVLDEPLSMLDSTSAIELVGYLADLGRAGTTTVLCEHRVEYCRAIPELRVVTLRGRPADLPGAAPEDPPLPALSSCRLEASGLSVEIAGRPILRNVSLALEGGQVVAVVGRNGVGKTTLLRALAGLQKHRGTVTVNGSRPDLGLVFQNADLQFFNATVRDEMLYRLPRPHRRYYVWLLQVLGLAGHEDVPPLLLSEGQKKRLALATVLMRRPRHGVLLDEPALGQDGAHKALLLRLAHALARSGQLVVMTTHDLTLAAQADRMLVLGPEGLVADGAPRTLLLDEAPWRQIGLVVPEWVKQVLARGEWSAGDTARRASPAAACGEGGQ